MDRPKRSGEFELVRRRAGPRHPVGAQGPVDLGSARTEVKRRPSNEKRDIGRCPMSLFSLNVREKIRTPDTLVRSQVLYPAELHVHTT